MQKSLLLLLMLIASNFKFMQKSLLLLLMLIASFGVAIAQKTVT